MPRKKDPWLAPLDESWIEVGKKIIPLPPNLAGSYSFSFGDSPSWSCSNLPANPTPHDMPVFVISRIDVTGNGTRMVHFHLVADPRHGSAWWSKDIKSKFRPAPSPKRAPRPKKPKPTPLSRFDREDVV